MLSGGALMLSSIIVLLLQFMGIIQPEISMEFFKYYIPVCILEIVIYFNVLSKWGKDGV
jgi:hypothetical protein